MLHSLTTSDNIDLTAQSFATVARLDWFADFEYEFVSRLTQCRIISFDVFDTALIRRHAHPYDVFMEVEMRAKSAGIRCDGFRHKRPQAEIDARSRRLRENGTYEDPTLDDIYRELSSQYAETSCLELRRIELEVESENIVRNPEIFALYQLAFNKKCRFVFISDMYIDEDTIASWLDRSGYVDRLGIWISSKSGRSKREGSLYLDVLQALGVAPEAVLHLGDNRQLDYENARAAGLQAMHYQPLMQGITPGNSIIISRQIGAWRNEALSRRLAVPPHAMAFDELGYIYGAPLALAFVYWLTEELVSLGEIDVAFCARDGWLLHQIYELTRQSFGRRLPESCYLLISRQALCLPAIASLEDEMARFLFAGGRNGTVRELLERIDMDLSAFDPEEFGLNLESGIRSSETVGKIWQFLRRHEKIVLAAAEKQRKLVERYFRGEGLLHRKRLLLVDLGWNASQQVAVAELLRLIGSDCVVTGRYLGLYSTAVRLQHFGLDAKAFLVGPGDSEEEQRALQGAVPLIESLFTAPHGSVRDYIPESDGGILPRLAEADFERRQWPRVSVFQQAVMRGVKDLLASGRHPTVDDARSAFSSMALRPSLRTAEACGELCHYDGVHPDACGQPLAGAAGLETMAPDDLRQEFSSAAWKWGWLERLSARIDCLPESLQHTAHELMNSRNNMNLSPWDSSILDMLKRAFEEGVTQAFVYGAGDFGVRVARLAKLKGIKITAFVDSSQALHGRRIEGLNVISLAEAMRTGPHCFFTGSFSWAKHIAGIIRQAYAGTEIVPRVYLFPSK